MSNFIYDKMSNSIELTHSPEASENDEIFKLLLNSSDFTVVNNFLKGQTT